MRRFNLNLTLVSNVKFSEVIFLQKKEHIEKDCSHSSNDFSDELELVSGVVGVV